MLIWLYQPESLYIKYDVTKILQYLHFFQTTQFNDLDRSVVTIQEVKVNLMADLSSAVIPCNVVDIVDESVIFCRVLSSEWKKYRNKEIMLKVCLSMFFALISFFRFKVDCFVQIELPKSLFLLLDYNNICPFFKQ